ncbi:MAG TPA: hypothetical protein IAB06_03560 [Candidatus Avacidaminococcus intestinavium]|uniref:Uncharacterized protein n=1 Tax=Candidatus Avacidaminococcus intestinavium TaxID=2840684 RepID=A0A9D1MPI8_9FIRM|nr:hypothetical protein [Candidatus Avacidaminococcus intestinavium]
MFGEIVANEIGKLSSKKRDQAMAVGNIWEGNKWSDGGEYKILLHSLAGGIMADLGGNDLLN